MAITYAQKPAEQFRDLIPTFRNGDIVAVMQPLVLLHQQIHSNGNLGDRSGGDAAFRNLILKHAARADRLRQRITFNPSNEKLNAITIPEIDAALKAELDKVKQELPLSEGTNPAAGDTVVMTTTQLIDVPWKFSGGDESGVIRLNSELEARFKSGPGYLVFGVVNEAIVGLTTTESRFRSSFISLYDSARIQSLLQRIVTVAIQTLGENNRLDVPEAVLSSERPSGPQSSPNALGEQSGNSNANQ